MKKLSKEEKICNKVKEMCSKKKISCQSDISYNGDIHLQFRQPATYGINYAECYVSNLDLRTHTIGYIIKNIKGFLHMSFRENNKKGYHRHVV